MCVVTIATGDATLVHLALQERTHDEDFFANLPVHKILRAAQSLQNIGLQEVIPVTMRLQWRSQRVTTPTHILLVLCARGAGCCDRLIIFKLPGDSVRQAAFKARHLNR